MRNLVMVVSKDGTQVARIFSLLTVQARANGDFLVTSRLNDEDSESLNDPRKILEGGQAHSSTRAIAASADMAVEFGALRLVADGQVVVFRGSDKDLLVVDGLVASSTAVLLNSFRSSPSNCDVTTVHFAVVTLKHILEAACFKSNPA